MSATGSTSSMGIGACAGLELHQAAQGAETARLVVHQLAVLFEGLIVVRATGILEFVNRFRTEEVKLAFASPLVFAAVAECLLMRLPVGKSLLVSQLHFLGNHIEANAADARRRPGEVAIDEVFVEADGLEDLRAAIALDRGDAHLRDDLDDAFVDRLDVVGNRLVRIDTSQQARGQSCLVRSRMPDTDLLRPRRNPATKQSDEPREVRRFQ